MRKAQALGWTQNAVILGCCETDTQRYFYITLAAEKNLSKLALIKEIERNTFGTALSDKAAQTACPTCCPVVSGIVTEEAVCTIATTETACRAAVPACEPPRQESGLSNDEIRCNTGFCSNASDKLPKLVNSKVQQKRSSRPTSKRSVELLQFAINILYKACRLPVPNRRPLPHQWRDFRMYEQGIVFA